jgi:hypothetical protein
VTLARGIALGGLTVGVLDGLDAVVFFGLRGVTATRIFQAIASGLLGRIAFQGRARTTVIPSDHGAVAQRCPAVARRPRALDRAARRAGRDRLLPR